MAISTAAATLADVRQTARKAMSLASRVHSIEEYLTATEGQSSYEEFLESDDLAGYKALSAAIALHWFKSADAPPSVKEDVLQAVAEAIKERPWLEEGLRFVPPPEVPEELKDALATHSRAVVAFIRGSVRCDSHEEFLDSDPDAGEKSIAAVKAIRWILDSDIHPRVKDAVLHAPANMIQEYPWIGEGLKWGAQAMKARAAAVA